MKEQNLKEVWKEASGLFAEKVEINKEKLSMHQKETSEKIFNDLRKGFIFDLILKSVITIAAIILLIISLVDGSILDQSSSSIFIMSFISMFLLSAMIVSAILSGKKFNEIPKDLPVLESLSRKLTFLKTDYRKFIFGSALTAPMFVFTANSYYFYHKYGEMRFDDPVILIFIFISFIIAYFAQIPAYNLQKKELEEAIADFDEDKAKEIEKAKIKQKRNYVIWMIIGIVLLITLFILFS